ncbi:MAG TPA: universal stress protein [Puia sp.]|nr:universal stress protein [Puia sp.]
MRSIVAPVNFAPNAANAARYAADIALAIGADLHLIYVLQIPSSASEVPVPESAFDAMRDSGYELLNDLQVQLTKRVGGKVGITTDLEVGGTEARIESYCKQVKPFLVVMGASGHNLENIINGSTTVRAIRHLPYPVLAIPVNAKFQSIKKIVVACDKEDIDSGMPDNIAFLNELSGLLKAHLVVVHVLTNGEESAAEATEEYNVWKKEVKAFNPEIHFVRRPRVEDGINEYLTSHAADWLMVFPKSHSVLEFHKSRSKQIVRTCAVPVMSLHE